VPIIAAEVILHLQHHHTTIVNYLSTHNKLETTGDLRSGIEDRMEIADKVADAQKTQVINRFESNETKHKDAEARTDEYKANNNSFRELKTVTEIN